VGSKPYQPQSGAVGFLTDQHQVQPDVAIAVILPIVDHRMIPATHFEWQIVCALFNDRKNLPIERDAVLTFTLAPVIPFELSGPFNRPN